MWFACALVGLLAVSSEGAENNTVKKLIFGGSVHKITDAPYFALYLKSQQPVCGASIINEKFLITAAHCYDRNGKYSVEVGTDRIKQGKVYNVCKTVIHPKYMSKKLNNDIAVIKIRGRLHFSDRVYPIRLAPRGYVLNHGDVLTTMGFGTTEADRDEGSNELRFVNIPYICDKQCKKILGFATDGIICAGGDEGIDSCHGDSGGPLVYRNILVGVVSFGLGDCGSALPAGYARVSALRDFIDSTVNKLSNKRIKL